VRLEVRSRAGEYAVHIAPGSTAQLAQLMDAARVPARRFIVSNALVWKLHENAFAGLSADDPILIPDGERYKTLQTAGRIYDGLIRSRADRSSAIIAVGGGVTGDIAGFAAATYLRGVPLVHVPTTLLAQVDSAIGGKVGVNHALGKNLIGAFHSPALVCVDPTLLTTLPRRDFRAGLYEIVKYGVIADRALFSRVRASLTTIFARDPGALLPVISDACAIKARIVQEDERESGLRRMLNFGHTAGHAIESATKYRRFRHGEAVAYGMLVAAEIAVARGRMPSADRQALAEAIAEMGPLPAVADLSKSSLLEAMRRDKKVAEGTLHYVLPRAIGECEVVPDVSRDEIMKALESIGVAAA
jgi:3-dehydroquinate synthase